MTKLTEKIAIFRIGSMGDTVVGLPCFHAVLRAFPNASITLITNIPISSLAAPVLGVLGKNSEFVHNAINYKIGLRNPIEAIRLLLKLRRLRTKTLIYLRSKPSRRMIIQDRVFFRLAGFSRILCIPRTDDQLYSRLELRTQHLEPESSRLARCCAPLGVIDLADSASWDLRLNTAERASGACIAANLPSPFLVIHTGGKAISNDWGYERWAQFLQLFKGATNFHGLAVVGAADDHLRADALCKIWGDGALNLCGGPAPREVAALLAHANLFIGHDSGPLHLTQCVGTPALGLFGSKNRPKIWHPIGSHVQVIHEQAGISFISVDQVLHKAQAILSKS